MSVIDMRHLRDITDGDAEFEKELFDVFFENARDNIDKMVNAVQSKNIDAWKASSHSFKGAAASIGAFDLSDILEHAQVSQNATAQEKEEILTQVRKRFAEVDGFVKSHLGG